MKVKDGRSAPINLGETYKHNPETGRDVPDESALAPTFRYVNPRPAAAWPKADFIVGNPPFIGNHRMRQALGDGYVEALRGVYPELPQNIDYVMYWWHRAAELARAGDIRRFGFITTNSIRQTHNRKVVEAQLNAKPPLSLLMAVPDHPWIDSDNGAQVRISMTAGALGVEPGILATTILERPGDGFALVDFDMQRGRINSNLTVGVDITKVAPLLANIGLSGPGVKLHGAGFIVSPEQATELGLGSIPGLEHHIRPYVNGRDIAGRSRNVMVIDLFGLTVEEVKHRYPNVYQWVVQRVKPERDNNNREIYRRNWWIFGGPRKNFRPVLDGLTRFIVTPETARRRYFIFLDKAYLADNTLIVIGSDDAYVLGVLSSRIHSEWALATGARLGAGNDPRYSKGVCFDPFPFPDATEKQKKHIRLLAEKLDAHRRARQTEYPDLTLTNLGIYLTPPPAICCV